MQVIHELLVSTEGILNALTDHLNFFDQYGILTLLRTILTLLNKIILELFEVFKFKLTRRGFSLITITTTAC